jgi:hypothetical protein
MFKIVAFSPNLKAIERFSRISFPVHAKTTTTLVRDDGRSGRDTPSHYFPLKSKPRNHYTRNYSENEDYKPSDDGNPIFGLHDEGGLRIKHDLNKIKQ